MPATISKIIDKAKPRFSFHRHRNEDKAEEPHHNKLLELASNLPTHIFGYKDGKKDNYVEPPPMAPTETQPREIVQAVLPPPTPIKEDCLTPGKGTIKPEDIPTTPPATPGNSFLAADESAKRDSHPASESSKLSSQHHPQETESDTKEEKSCQLKLSDFKVDRTLGTGSFGRVLLIQSKVNHRFYALKVLKKKEIVKLKQVEHTNNERSILAELQHPFIVNLWGSFQDNANLYMVMDFVPGGELFSLLRKSKKFSPEIARFYAGEVLLGLAYLHSKEIIYRDLKPENILLDAHGHIKITDFGFAKNVPDITWTLCGTPDYLAPEIIQTKGYGKAADFWAFGILIYEMLAGCPPYYDDNQFKLYEKILTVPPSYPSHMDSAAKDLLSHLLTTDLSRRYGNLKRGYKDIMEHKWFEPLDFKRLVQRKIKPPHIPHLKGLGDAANYDRYPEELLQNGDNNPNETYQDQFPDF
ncbi:kinase-like domain-containing protein [Sporodiniella umbellata]|nr:kinase-like domain-containing protein [Sporodiniella umbellata]